MTPTLNTALLPAGREPLVRVHCATGNENVQLHVAPPEVVTPSEEKVVPGGIVSLTTVVVTSLGPLFLMVIV